MPHAPRGAPAFRRTRPGTSRRAVRRADTIAGFWFLTVLVALGGPVLFVIILLIDKSQGNGGVLGFLIISPDSARTILGSIAGSLITIASLTASLTIVTLQLLSNQYTPRAVRGFLRKRVSQVVSGAFVGIFLYCVLLLVAVREPGDENEPFVPSLGVVSAIALSILGLVLLILFINSLAKTIQVSTMTAEIARDTIRAISTVYAPIGETAGDGDVPAPDRLEGVEIPAGTSGYVRLIALGADDQLPIAPRRGPWRAEMLVRPGDFVTAGQAVARMRSAEPPDEATREAIRDTVLIGFERDLDQDPSFGVRQLVDIALRALSPGINDPTTAVTCIGYLRWIYEELAGRSLLGRWSVPQDDGGSVVRVGFTFEDYLQPLAEIATYAGSDPRVMLALLDALARISSACRARGGADRCAPIADLAADLVPHARDGAQTGWDRRRLDGLVERIVAEADAAQS